MEADVSRLATGQAPASQPSTPSEKPAKTPDIAAPRQPATVEPTRPSSPPPTDIQIPEKQGAPLFRKVLFVVLALVILLALGYGIVSLFSRQAPEPTPTPTPTPTPIATLKPSTASLVSIFGQRSGTLALSDIPQQLSDVEVFRNKLNELVPDGRTGRNVALEDTKGAPVSAAGTVMDAFGSTCWGGDTGPSHPSTSAMGQDYAFIIFGQTEHYDGAGEVIEGATTEPRLAVILELTDATAVRQSFELCEDQFISDFQYVLDHDPASAILTEFDDGAYRQVPLRYINFPYANRSIDWAIVPASNGLNYLVISGSRQSFFFAIDQLLK